ncbi:MAG: WbuC family cupin fold metalloprotein [Synergistaceae bacterium]|nr:WbuC family cupin fold metalloprotein [Synergistaceae bacterium]
MVIDSKLLDSLSAQAKASPRLRMNFDLRNSPSDGSQRMLNALEPGTELPIHRHMKSSETIVILRGSATQYFYDDAGQVTERVTIAVGGPCVGMSVEAGRWHRLVPHEPGTVILEYKDGPYEPLAPSDIKEIPRGR